MKICIVGTGYVGLVSAACFAEMGNTVTCVDINASVVASLNAGQVHIYEPGLEGLVQRNHEQGRLVFTTSLQSGLQDAAAVFVCVGTPPLPDGSCDLSYVRQVAHDIGKYVIKPLVIINKSTVPVGTADLVRQIVEEQLVARQIGFSCEVASNPEFLKEGDAVNDFMRPDRVIVGTCDAQTADLLQELYAPFARTKDKFMVMGVRSAEMTKYTANCMLATKISFMNEIAGICEQVGADVREVRMGIGADHRIGYHFIYPGIGYGGSCFPKDVKALIHTASEAGCEAMLLRAVDTVNTRQKAVMAERILDYFASQGGVEGKTLALWGLTFKANTDDMRESPTLVIIDILTKHGMRIQAYDPEASNTAGAILANNPHVVIVNEQYSALEGAAALLVATDWNQFRTPDFNLIKEKLEAPILFDGRNLYSPAALAKRGFAYFCIGRQPAI